MNKLNPKQHALMRYLSRVHNEIIVTDNAFKDWQNRYPEKVEEARQELTEISGICDLAIIGKYNKENQEREYRFYIKEMLILVCDKDNILTIYPIEFGDGLSEKANLNIFKSMYEDYCLLMGEKETFLEKHIESINELDESISSIEDTIKLKRAEIQKLELLKSGFENSKKEVKVKEEQLNLKIKAVAKKLVNPAFAFKGE